MTFFKSSSSSSVLTLTGSEQKKIAEFHLFLHQNYGGPSKNQTVPVAPGNGSCFGQIDVNDWDIREGCDPGSKLIARAQGQHIGSGKNKAQWYTSFNMVFEDERLKGSSLVVQGAWDVNALIEWAVVGGTGQFTFAQGVLYGTKLSQDAHTRVLEINIHVLYRPVQRPASPKHTKRSESSICSMTMLGCFCSCQFDRCVE